MKYNTTANLKFMGLLRVVPKQHSLICHYTAILYHQCCHFVMKKKHRIYLEKKTENNKKTQTYKMLKKLKPNLKCMLAILSHKN